MKTRRNERILEAMKGKFDSFSRERLTSTLAAGLEPEKGLLQLFREEGVPLEGREDLLRAIYILYLYTLDPWFLHLGAILYSGASEALKPLLENRVKEALAIAAGDAGSVEVLLALYHIDVGIEVLREILPSLLVKKKYW